MLPIIIIIIVIAVIKKALTAKAGDVFKMKCPG